MQILQKLSFQISENNTSKNPHIQITAKCEAQTIATYPVSSVYLRLTFSRVLQVFLSMSHAVGVRWLGRVWRADAAIAIRFNSEEAVDWRVLCPGLIVDNEPSARPISGMLLM
jgi:hypothetical protein